MQKSKVYIISLIDLMKEWDWGKNNELGLFPDRLTVNSRKKVWWKCSDGYSWDAVIAKRVRGVDRRFYAEQILFVERSLAVKFPELSKEWDYVKNAPLTPNDVTYGSQKIVFWICPICHQSYPKKISNRTAPSKQKTESKKCPVCLGRYIIPEYNSLKALYPDIIAKEWDYEKNILTPDSIAPHSNQVFWWKCEYNHSYAASPNNKISKNGGECPYCSGHRVSDQNRLTLICPELAKQWHPTKNNKDASDVSFGSNEDAWWLCPICSYEWKAKINNRYNGRGCPNCSKGQHTSFPEQVIYYYIKLLFPDAVSQYKLESVEIDVFIPSVNIAIEYDGGYWHKSLYKYKKDICKNKFIYNHHIHLIRIRESDCYQMTEDHCKIFPIVYTSNYETLTIVIKEVIKYIGALTKLSLYVDVDIQKVRNNIISSAFYVKPANSFAAFMVNNPDVVKADWDYDLNFPLTPEMVKPHSSKYAHWICKQNKNHRWTAPISSISNGFGCSRCANRYQYSTEEWIEQAMEVHGDKYDYSKVEYVNSDTDVVIICTTHGEFKQNPSRHLSGNGCPWCVGQGGFHPLNSLAKVRPDLALEWDYEHIGNKGLTPRDVAINDSVNEYWWKCNNGKPHSYKASISFRISRDSGCAVCHGKQISYDTSLEFLRPDLAKEWHDSNTIKPSEVSLGSEIRVKWKCNNPDHPIYETSVISRAKSKFGCKYCSGDKKSHEAFVLELAAIHPNIELISRYTKSSEKIKYKCKICNSVYEAFPANIIKRRYGCNNCKV